MKKSKIEIYIKNTWHVYPVNCFFKTCENDIFVYSKLALNNEVSPINVNFECTTKYFNIFSIQPEKYVKVIGYCVILRNTENTVCKYSSRAVSIIQKTQKLPLEDKQFFPVWKSSHIECLSLSNSEVITDIGSYMGILLETTSTE